MTEEDNREDLEAGLDALDKDYETVVAQIRSWPNPEEAFAYATELADAERKRADASARLRAESAARIAASEKMSLATLAGRIGVSRARADQLVRTAKAIREQDQ